MYRVEQEGRAGGRMGFEAPEGTCSSNMHMCAL